MLQYNPHSVCCRRVGEFCLIYSTAAFVSVKNTHGPTNNFCDNNSVVLNVSIPEPTLAKKHSAINYHIIREAVAAGIIRVGKEDTLTNIADVFTKLVPFTKKYQLLSPFLWDR